MVASRGRDGILYVTGYWRLPGNTKRPVEHYARELPRSLEMIAGGPLLLYHDDPAVEAAVAEACAPLGIDLRPVRLPVADLPGFRHGDALVAGCRAMPREGPRAIPANHFEKGHMHYTRDLVGSGEATYRALLAVWLSKVPLTARAAAAPQAPRFVAWMDASIARFSGRRSNWDFPNQPFAEDALNHYASPMRYLGRPLPLNASFLAARGAVWAEVEAAFAAELEARLGDAYAHDEETVLGHVHARRPALFHTLGVPHAPPEERRGLVARIRRRLSSVARRRA